MTYIKTTIADAKTAMNLNTARILCLSRVIHESLSYLLLQSAAEVESLHRCLQEHFIGLAYELLLTLPVSPVTCERCFSALKRITNRLRSTMTQEYLEAFMLVSVEKGILPKPDNKPIIDSVAATSELCRHLLC